MPIHVQDQHGSEHGVYGYRKNAGRGRLLFRVGQEYLAGMQ